MQTSVQTSDPQLDNSKHDQWRNPGHKHNVWVTQKGATHNARKEHLEKHPCGEQNHALPQVGQKAKTTIHQNFGGC